LRPPAQFEIHSGGLFHLIAAAIRILKSILQHEWDDSHRPAKDCADKDSSSRFDAERQFTKLVFILAELDRV
jgi:hypothetical protein